ncbi:unnamed protein product [Staurois parvus]|uniref:Uncharacterized protein n=1 Tax=Staurois parvus TaxID=386267 RepID=A0ABN9F1L0_9NEOB|nr:unnamed protein product [Staurois parvus]
MGPCTASSCCCQVQSVSWVPVRPPIAAARPVICHGPPYRLSSCCCQARNLSWAPVPPPHAAARSRVCHGSLYGLPLLLPGP